MCNRYVAKYLTEILTPGGNLTSYIESTQNLTHQSNPLGLFQKPVSCPFLYFLRKNKTKYSFKERNKTVNILNCQLSDCLPPCFLCLFLPSSHTTVSCSEKESFLFNKALFSWPESRGSEDTLFKPSSLARSFVELRAWADCARLKLPLTGSSTSGPPKLCNSEMN